MSDYLPLFVLFVLATIFAGVSFFASRLLNPPRPNPAKTAPYECGIVPGREPPERFPVRFFLVAMIFIMFDVEIIFLFPWAVVGRRFGSYAFYEILVFSAIFFAAFLYLVARGGLDWGPQSRARRLEVARAPGRTSTSTIRRVGLEGRPAEATAPAAAAAEHSEDVA